MRKRGVLAKADEDSALHAEIAKCRRAVTGKFLLRHAFASGGPRRAVRDDREVVGLLHQREFRRRLVHSTARRNWCRADVLDLRRSLANTIVKEKPHALFYADSPRSHAASVK